MSRKVIEVRGRIFAVENRGIRDKLLLEFFDRRTDEQLDMYAEEYKQEQEQGSANKNN